MILFPIQIPVKPVPHAHQIFLAKFGMTAAAEAVGRVGKSNEFDGAIQDAVTEYCWGMGWGREGVLDRKMRSMLNLAMLTALGKPHELRAHTRGALRNGVTVEEIREVLIHATVYCGIPAGVDAFRNAKEAIDAWEADQK